MTPRKRLAGVGVVLAWAGVMPPAAPIGKIRQARHRLKGLAPPAVAEVA